MKETKAKILTPNNRLLEIRQHFMSSSGSTATTDSKDTGPVANESYGFLPCILSLFPDMGNALAAFCAKMKILLTAKVLGCSALQGSDVLKPPFINLCP